MFYSLKYFLLHQYVINYIFICLKFLFLQTVFLIAALRINNFFFGYKKFNKNMYFLKERMEILCSSDYSIDIKQGDEKQLYENKLDNFDSTKKDFIFLFLQNDLIFVNQTKNSYIFVMPVSGKFVILNKVTKVPSFQMYFYDFETLCID